MRPLASLGPMANRLADETSPYLLQHKDNPVEWYAWGDEALERARAEDKPILLSIGYSACHWCHVMEHESFEDAETAAYMNEHFVPIKVDREERPDVDAIYMEAVQGMTGHGGWPLTAFLDPEGVPFYGGTYFPPEPRQGMPSFRMVMEAVVESWGSQRERIEAAASRIRDQLGAVARIEPSTELLSPEIVDAAVRQLRMRADMRNGGFGSAPKFPPASALELLLARGATDVVEVTLDAMAAGGIHDQIGGGFARYSVDDVWLVPHFEKMLYDNALLARAYLHGWQALGHERWRTVCERTLDWALREMRGPEGGFYSALDADSEGEEGRFYVWTPAEIREVLGPAGLGEVADEVITHYGVTDEGNFEGRNILHLPAGAAAPEPPRLAEARRRPLRGAGEAGVAGARRQAPLLPGTRSCSVPWPRRAPRWAATTTSTRPADAPSSSSRSCATPKAACCAPGRTARESSTPTSRTTPTWSRRCWRSTRRRFEVRWFEAARRTADEMIERFADDERGGFFTTSHDHGALIARRKDVDDHPIPSGNSSAALGLLRLAALTGERDYEQRAVSVFRLFHRRRRGPPARRRSSAPGDRLPLRRGQGGGAGGAGGPERRRGRATRRAGGGRALDAFARTSCSRAGPRAPRCPS